MQGLLLSGQAASLDLVEVARDQGYEFDLLLKPVPPTELLFEVGKIVNGTVAIYAVYPAEPTTGGREAREMSDKEFLIRFKHPELSIQSVIASSAEIHGEHIALLNSKGKLTALFLTEVVESWSECAPCKRIRSR